MGIGMRGHSHLEESAEASVKSWQEPRLEGRRGIWELGRDWWRKKEGKTEGLGSRRRKGIAGRAERAEAPGMRSCGGTAQNPGRLRQGCERQATVVRADSSAQASEGRQAARRLGVQTSPWRRWWAIEVFEVTLHDETFIWENSCLQEFGSGWGWTMVEAGRPIGDCLGRPRGRWWGAKRRRMKRMRKRRVFYKAKHGTLSLDVGERWWQEERAQRGRLGHLGRSWCQQHGRKRKEEEASRSTSFGWSSLVLLPLPPSKRQVSEVIWRHSSTQFQQPTVTF